MTARHVVPGRVGPLLVLLLFCSACAQRGESLAGQADNAVVDAEKVKLLVDEEGVYRVEASELAAGGLAVPESLTYEAISLSDGPDSVPFLIADGALIFYGRPAENPYYRARPYLLQINQPGQAMTQMEPPAERGAPLPNVTQALHLEENHLYVSEARREEGDDVWFWSKLAPQESFTADFVLPIISEGPATLRFAAWGATHDQQVEGDHDVEVLVNDTAVGTAVWDGQTHHTATFSLAPGVLREGLNRITLDNRPEGAAFLDIMQINWFELEYPTPPRALGDRIDFTAAGGNVSISGLGSPPTVLNISDPGAPQSAGGWDFAEGILHLPVAGGMRVAAVGPQGYLKPRLEAVRESNWRDPSQQADLIIITTDALAPALAPLVEARKAEGLGVAVVPVAEIYDAFGHGAPSPESIRNFIAYAYRNWQAPQPRYLLIAGDATSDYLGHLRPLPDNLVPAPMVPVQYSGETVSDSRLVDVDDDLRPDLAVGRWPVRTSQEAADLVKRTLAYENGATSARAIFATDGSEEVFSRIARDLATKANLPPEQVAQRDGPTAEEIGQLWREGAWLATYVGHGSVDRWGKDNILSLDELENLSSDALPIVLQLTCLTGLFSHPEQVSLGEAMLLHRQGPVLIVAASSLTLSAHQEPFAVALMQQLQSSAVDRAGDAFLAAKRSLDVGTSSGQREISDTFALLGDPSARIARP